MTIDEAIRHCEEVAEEKEAQAWEAQLQEEYRTIKSCKGCAEEHRQLAEWLKELKQLREQEPCEDCISRKALLDKAWYVPYEGYKTEKEGGNVWARPICLRSRKRSSVPGKRTFTPLLLTS